MGWGAWCCFKAQEGFMVLDCFSTHSRGFIAVPFLIVEFLYEFYEVVKRFAEGAAEACKSFGYASWGLGFRVWDLDSHFRI